MEETSVQDVQKSLAVRLARHKIDDNVVKNIAHRVAKNGFKVCRLDICPYGICIDYFADKSVSIDEFLGAERYRAVKTFPYGIPIDDLYHLRVEMEVPELAESGVFG